MSDTQTCEHCGTTYEVPKGVTLNRLASQTIDDGLPVLAFAEGLRFNPEEGSEFVVLHRCRRGVPVDA